MKHSNYPSRSRKIGDYATDDPSLARTNLED